LPVDGMRSRVPKCPATLKSLGKGKGSPLQVRFWPRGWVEV